MAKIIIQQIHPINKFKIMENSESKRMKTEELPIEEKEEEEGEEVDDDSSDFEISYKRSKSKSKSKTEANANKKKSSGIQLLSPHVTEIFEACIENSSKGLTANLEES